MEDIHCLGFRIWCRFFNCSAQSKGKSWSQFPQKEHLRSQCPFCGCGLLRPLKFSPRRVREATADKLQLSAQSLIIFTWAFLEHNMQAASEQGNSDDLCKFPNRRGGQHPRNVQNSQVSNHPQLLIHQRRAAENYLGWCPFRGVERLELRL